ncbi:MAG: DsbA family oxidoreductase [Vicinamibacterales bacterium]
MHIDIWSDIVCPWCYVGKRRFEEGLRQFGHAEEVIVRHHAFQLDPSAIPGEITSRRARLKAKYGLTDERVAQLDQQMAQTFQSVGLTFLVGEGTSGNTRAAHEVVAAGAAVGRQDAVIERLFRAYFSEGRSVFDPAELVTLGVEAGLEEGALRQALIDGTYAESVEQDLADAREIGITGVPFFVFDRRFALSGAQPANVFAQALTQAWESAEGAR